MDIDNLSVEETLVLAKLAGTPEGARKIVATMTKGLRPPSEKRKLFRAPYYQEKFGKEIEPSLRAILADKKDRIVFYSDFPYISKRSLYLRIYQAKCYAEDNFKNLDESKIKIGVNTANKKGITLKYLTDDVKPLVAHPLDNPNALVTWRNELDTFLTESPIGTKFVKDTIDLSPQEVLDLKITLNGLPGIISVVKQHEIKILKIDPDEPSPI